jgi:hypothetical protein
MPCGGSPRDWRPSGTQRSDSTHPRRCSDLLGQPERAADYTRDAEEAQRKIDSIVSGASTLFT